MNERKRNHLIVGALLACVTGCAAPEETEGTEAPEREPVRVQLSRDTEAVHEHVSLAKTRNGRMAATWTAREPDFWRVMISFSDDQGETWSDPTHLLPDDRENLWPSDRASIVAGPDGSFYVAFHAVGSVQVARVAPGAQRVAEVIVVSEASIISKPQIIVDAAGQVHVLYRDNHTTKLAYAAGSWPSLSHLYPPVAEADSASFCADEKGSRLYVVYRETSGGVQAVTKPDPGKPWQATGPIEIIRSGSNPGRPTCVAQGDEMWATYVDSADQIWVARTELGQPFPTTNWLLSLPGGTARTLPRIALAADGTHHVVHFERRDDAVGSLHHTTMVDGVLGETHILSDDLALSNMQTGWLAPSVLGGDVLAGVYVTSQYVDLNNADRTLASQVQFFSEPL